MHGGEVVYQPGEVLGPRILKDYELVTIIEGSVNYESGGECSPVKPGCFILGQPGFSETYHWDPQQHTRHAFFHFGIERVSADWPDPDHWPRVRNAANPLCTNLFRHILQHMYEHNDGSIVRPTPADCRLVEVLMDALFETPHAEITSFERERPEPVRRALMHIRRLAEEDPHHPLTLTELADQANITEKHLCRLFAKWVGHSPIQTYSLVKLEASLPLLTRTNLSIKEVAQRCGFENPLYFSRLFSRHFNDSPRGFRAQLQKGTVPPRKILPTDLTPRIRW